MKNMDLDQKMAGLLTQKKCMVYQQNPLLIEKEKHEDGHVQQNTLRNSKTPLSTLICLNENRIDLFLVRIGEIIP